MKSLFILLLVGVAFAEEEVQQAEPETPEDIIFQDYSKELNDESYEDDNERGISKPTCSHQGNTVSCCLNINVKGNQANTCVELALKLNEMKAVATLKYNNHNIISKDASVGKLCAPLPAPLSMLSACLNVYYAAVNIQKKSADVCFVVEIKMVAQGSFGCFRLQDGKFQHHNEHPPEKHGIINIGWNGKPTVQVPKWVGKVPGKIGKIFHG